MFRDRGLVEIERSILTARRVLSEKICLPVSQIFKFFV